MEDQKIVQLYWDRNEKAILETSAKYGVYCTSIAKNILGNTEDAKECVNDTYLSAWNSIPPHKPRMLSAFLGKIVRNLSLNRYRHNAAAKRGGGQLPLVLEELSDYLSAGAPVEQEMDHKELVAAINDFLDALSADKRNIFVCRYWYFDSLSDIGSRFGMTEKNVSVTLSRLRLKLHNYLSKRGFDL
ncbi:sigma-70 family RNA polymerase sigma factor [Anaerofilum sp. BX8]|uniref:Sigma-70 family RNA polymerase sigma factor n=1 Tax=Anaerofilum hominis TaxID=2763016 RepID=A0A923I704_9FIRM|nr:sigma-70 family RNA polymerase sigma factor [Anaerofilum hominis]MBC5581455.1 sigma-70 family RNA polymerase sigma factor [Anaerofilum hominis]